MPALTTPRWLLACPFCGHLMRQQYDRPNPKARCMTEGCYIRESMPVLNLDDDTAVQRWNTRPKTP